MQVTDVEIIDLILSILDSPYANHLTRQFVFASITKISSRPITSPNQQERIAAVLAGYTTNPELELQQRAVEFASLFALGELRVGVLERMPPPELKATVTGVGVLFDDIFVIDAKTNWRVRWLAYGESRIERIRSTIPTSVTCTPTEAIRSGKRQGNTPYRCGMFLIHESTLD